MYACFKSQLPPFILGCKTKVRVNQGNWIHMHTNFCPKNGNLKVSTGIKNRKFQAKYSGKAVIQNQLSLNLKTEF